MRKAKVTTTDELRKNLNSAYMDNIGLACISSLTNDSRMKGKKVGKTHVAKMNGIIEEWKDLFSPIIFDMEWPTRIFLDMFFGDYASAKKKIQFYKEKQERILERKKEEIRAFDKVLQKFNEKK